MFFPVFTVRLLGALSQVLRTQVRHSHVPKELTIQWRERHVPGSSSVKALMEEVWSMEDPGDRAPLPDWGYGEGFLEEELSMLMAEGLSG